MQPVPSFFFYKKGVKQTFLSAMDVLVGAPEGEKSKPVIDYAHNKRLCSNVCMSRRPSAIKST